MYTPRNPRNIHHFAWARGWEDRQGDRPMSQVREKQGGGGGNSGEGKTYHKSPPQKRFWTPPLMIRFPPPLCSRNVILLRGNGHRPDKSHFLRPPNWFWRGVLYGTFSPPKSHDALGQKSCRTKVSRIFRFFGPNFAPNLLRISPNFLRSFRASFCGRRRPEKIHPKSPPFFNAKFPGNFEEKIHKVFAGERSKQRYVLPPPPFANSQPGTPGPANGFQRL